MSYDVFDRVEVRCPQLGGEVTFGYCRTLEEGLPCRRALVCFERMFPVEIYFRRVLRTETYARCFSPGHQSRYEALLDAVDQASERVAGAAADATHRDPSGEDPGAGESR